MSAAMEAVQPTQYLSFFIAGEEYAIGILRVKEIIEYDTITRVPAMPLSIRGVINLRGSVVPVVDLATKFGLPECEITPRTCIVIVEVELDGRQTVMGVMADAVSQVIDLLPEDIEEPPAFGTRVRVDHLLGMGKAGKKFVMILDIDRVLSSSELLAAASIGDETGLDADTEAVEVDGLLSQHEPIAEQAFLLTVLDEDEELPPPSDAD